MQHQVHADQGTKKKPAPMFGRMGHSCNVGIASYPVSLVLKGEDYTVMIFKHTNNTDTQHTPHFLSMSLITYITSITTS